MHEHDHITAESVPTQEGVEVFSFPPTLRSRYLGTLCEFHFSLRDRTILFTKYFRLQEPWECPSCGTPVAWAYRADDPEAVNEFVSATTMLAHEFVDRVIGMIPH
jgi:rubredoxin